MKDLETRLFTETHTKDILTIEKQVLYDKVNKLKSDNQNMGRTLEKEKTFSTKDDVEKKRRKDLEALQAEINAVSDKIESEKTLLEEEQERNDDPQLLKNQIEKTMKLQSEHTNKKNELVADDNKITALTTKIEMLNKTIADGLQERRKIVKYNQELKDKISGANVTEDMQK